MAKPKKPVPKGGTAPPRRSIVCIACLAAGGIALLLGLLGIFQGPSPTGAVSPFAVMGYLPEYRLGPAVEDWAPGRRLDRVAGLVSDLVLFSVEPHASGVLDAGRLPPAHLTAAAAAKARHRGLRLLVSVGGGGRGAHIPALFRSPKKRRQFMGSTLAFLQAHGLDGVDFDWEGQASPQQWQGYAALLQEAKEFLRPHSFLVTVAVHPWQVLDAPGFAQVDRVHVMAYDLAARHATFEDSVRAVEGVVSGGGLRWDQAAIGVPLYGRLVQNPSEAKTYADLCEQFDPAANQDEVSGWYFNGPATVRRKAQWAKQRGLAGVMVWEVGQDSPDPARSLLETLASFRT